MSQDIARELTAEEFVEGLDPAADAVEATFEDEPTETDEPGGLVRALPDFPLAQLLRFLPDPRLKQRLQRVATEALRVDAHGADGVARADAALGPVRDEMREIEQRFELPCDLANQLHKRLTGLRADFLAPGKEAVTVVGRRLADEQWRLEAEAAAERRRLQEDADRQERDRLKAEAAAARAAGQASVADQIAKEAETAVAAPVPAPATAPALKGSVVRTAWKARLRCGCVTSPYPCSNPREHAHGVQVLLRAIMEGAVPAEYVEINWTAINARAKADKQAFRVPGFEAYEDRTLAAKGQRG